MFAMKFDMLATQALYDANGVLICAFRHKVAHAGKYKGETFENRNFGLGNLGHSACTNAFQYGTFGQGLVGLA